MSKRPQAVLPINVVCLRLEHEIWLEALPVGVLAIPPLNSFPKPPSVAEVGTQLDHLLGRVLEVIV